MVPISDSTFMIDLIEELDLPAALVVRNYLGCINHSLLSIMALQQRGIQLEYLILNGDFPEDTERVICSFIEKETKMIKIPEIENTDKESIQHAAQQLTITKL